MKSTTNAKKTLQGSLQKLGAQIGGKQQKKKGWKNRMHMQKTNCLKMYCECFSTGKMCTPQCACYGCYNHTQHQKAIDQAKQQLKLKGTVSNRHTDRACNCKKSQCKKNTANATTQAYHAQTHAIAAIVTTTNSPNRGSQMNVQRDTDMPNVNKALTNLKRKKAHESSNDVMIYFNIAVDLKIYEIPQSVSFYVTTLLIILVSLILLYIESGQNIDLNNIRQACLAITWLHINLLNLFKAHMNHSISTMTGKTKIKIVFLGNQSVGKSSIIQKYINDRFDETANPTVGIDFLAKNVVHKAKNFRLQLWDTAGQQRFRSLIPSYLKDAHCSLIIFDVTDRQSLSNADMWLKLYSDNKTGEGFTFLIGNKIDLDYREITQEQGMKKAQQLKIPYFQISAKTGQNLQMLFSFLIQACENKSLNGISFNLNNKINKSQIIDEENVQEENDTKTVNKGPTGLSNKGMQKTQIKDKNTIGNNNTGTNFQEKGKDRQNIVLKNQKTNRKQSNKKEGCC